jgi:hypothetical protein
MDYISLDRRFISWSDNDKRDPELLGFMESIGGSLTWEKLRARRRVVILAEAGSGKTAELLEQKRLVSELGQFSFYATVQNIGSKGTDRALGKLEMSKLNQWLASNQPAWFFIDSVDEAKADNIKLDDALHDLADNIAGALGRAHIIISGRLTDWEFRRDLSAIETHLPVPPPDAAVAPVDPNQLVLNVIRQTTQTKTPEVERPTIFVMAPLDRARMETFARARGAMNIEAFFAALDKSNLWDFARRPLDFDWLVNFWQSHGKFGRLSEMLQRGLEERLQETNITRARRDRLDAERAMEAIERIGAALVLQRINTISVPDSKAGIGEVAAALDLTQILPDWSSEDRAYLITRPVFDPANAGYVRLHNDNRGTVRSYLCARWLRRLRTGNCPWRSVKDLLFATNYGLDLVKPSMRETVAWLALWDSDVAREAINRDPMLFTDCGDPASLSLADRQNILGRVVSQLATDETISVLDHDALQRFSAPDMAPLIRQQWNQHSESVAVRTLLLQMIDLGAIEACVDIAESASFGAFDDVETQLLSSRALASTANHATKQRYVEYLKKRAASLDLSEVWNGIDGLFPDPLTPEDMLAIFAAAGFRKLSESPEIDYLGPKIVQRLTSASDVEKILAALLAWLGSAEGKEENDSEDLPGRNSFLSTVEAAGRRLLELSRDVSPPMLAIDAEICICSLQKFGRQSPQGDRPSLGQMLQKTPEGRRAMLWRAAESLSKSTLLFGYPLTHLWQVRSIGIEFDFTTSDLEWLLRDAAGKTADNDQRLVANIALDIWQRAGAPPLVLDQIKAVSDSIPSMQTVITERLSQPPPSEREQFLNERIRRQELVSAKRLEQQDKSWASFADDIRANPRQLRELRPPSSEGVDSRLYHLWQLLTRASGNQSKYAIADLDALRPIFNESTLQELRQAFIGYWRHWQPTLRSEVAEDQRNRVSAMDMIGIIGVTLEAGQTRDWAAQLNDDEARIAATYATLELNGFPDWLANLATAKPNIALEVFARYIAADVSEKDDGKRRDALENLARADDPIVELLAGHVFQIVETERLCSPQAMNPALRILVRGFSQRDQLLKLLLSGFENAKAPAEKSAYIGYAYAVNADQATAKLMEALDEMPPASQTALAAGVLPRIFEPEWSRHDIHIRSLSAANLEQLVKFAYRAIRVEDDNEHPSGKAYTPDDRDNAESARSVAFRALTDMPGLATFDAINRLKGVEGYPIPGRRLTELAYNRAARDAETSPWVSSDIREFEVDFLTAPRTPLDLQRVAMQRLADLQHDLVHADFNQGKVVARLPKEVDVQNWFANALRERQGRSYSIEREPHVVEEKEPDLRLRAKATDASLPIEITVAESWSFKALELALTAQLRGRYLRDHNDRWGILLLVHQTARSEGWIDHDGNLVGFEQVTDHLKSLARSIAAKDASAPQMAVSVIDVSTVER